MTRRGIVTFDKYRNPQSDCHDDGRRDNSEAVFLLAQTLTALNARFAFVESEQARSINDVVVRLDLILDRLGIAAPDLTNTPIVSTLLITTVEGAPAAFATLQSTADDQDDRLSQLEAA